MRQRGDTELWATVIMLFLALFGSCAYSDISCSSRWSKSGLETSWGPIQGCLVRVPDGRWVPSDNVRGVDLRGTDATD